MFKAKGKNGTRVFSSIEEALAWDPNSNIFNVLAPHPVEPASNIKLAYVFITHDEKGMFGSDSCKLYDHFSIPFMLKRIGYDVDTLTSYPYQDTIALNEVDPSDYDLVLVQFGPPRIDDGVPSDTALDAYRFLAKLSHNDEFALIQTDINVPFWQFSDVDNIDSKFKTSEYFIKAKCRPFSLNSSLGYTYKAICGGTSIKYLEPVSFPWCVSSYYWAEDYLKLNTSPEKLHVMAYPGTLRLFGDRLDAFKRFFTDWGEYSYHSLLWSGANKDTVESVFGKQDHISYMSGTSNNRGAVIEEVYDLGLFTLLPYERGVEKQITPRVIEAMLSNSIVIIDDKFPISYPPASHFYKDRDMFAMDSLDVFHKEGNMDVDRYDELNQKQKDYAMELVVKGSKKIIEAIDKSAIANIGSRRGGVYI